MNKYVDGLAMLFSQSVIFFSQSTSWQDGETATFWEVKYIEDDMLVDTQTFSLQTTCKQIKLCSAQTEIHH